MVIIIFDYIEILLFLWLNFLFFIFWRVKSDCLFLFNLLVMLWMSLLVKNLFLGLGKLRMFKMVGVMLVRDLGLLEILREFLLLVMMKGMWFI